VFESIQVQQDCDWDCKCIERLGRMLQCVAVCCRVLQCVAVCCSVERLRRKARESRSTRLTCCSVCAMGCSALQCAAECCRVLHWVLAARKGKES